MLSYKDWKPSPGFVLNKAYIREALLKWDELKQNNSYLQEWKSWEKSNLPTKEKNMLRRGLSVKWHMKFLLDPNMKIDNDVLFGKPANGSNEQLLIDAIVYYALGNEEWKRMKVREFLREEYMG